MFTISRPRAFARTSVSDVDVSFNQRLITNDTRESVAALIRHIDMSRADSSSLPSIARFRGDGHRHRFRSKRISRALSPAWVMISSTILLDHS